jgi:hypothetical protein
MIIDNIIAAMFCIILGMGLEELIRETMKK